MNHITLIKSWKKALALIRKQAILIWLIIFHYAVYFVSAQNITRPNIEGPAGLEANSFTGSLFYQRSDLFIQGRGLSIDITFSYNSADRAKDWGFGFGWTFTYNQFYEFDTTGILVYRGDGRKDLFKSVGSVFQAPKGVFNILTQYSPNKYKLKSKDGIEYYFDDASSRKLTRIKDRNGNEITIQYNDNYISAIKDASGRIINFNWVNKHLNSIQATLSSVTKIIKYNYDAGSGNLTSVTNPLQNVIFYTYGPSRLMSVCKDANGNATNITYNSRNAVIRFLSCEKDISISYDSSAKKTFVIEANGTQAIVTTYQFDIDGRLISKSGNCCGFKNIYTYDDYNNISSITDANNNITIYGYDSKGNLISETDPLGETTVYSYDTTYSEITSVTDKNGNKTTYSYDTKGNLLKTVQPLNITTGYGYDTYGNRTGITDPRNNKTTFEYNQFGYILSSTYPDDGIIQFTYDDWGNLLTQVDQNKNVTAFKYDMLNQLTTVTDALQGKTIFTYDANGNKTSITDANSNITKFDYDPLNKLIAVTDAEGHISGTTYDVVGNIISKTDANGNTKTFSYDDLNRLLSETNAAGERTSYSYDPAGNKVSMLLPNGNTIYYVYDQLNRLVSIFDNLGSIMAYTYDANSNKLSETDAKGNTTNYKYDAVNRLVSTTDPSGNSYLYAYDNNSNLVKETDRNGYDSKYEYDKMNRRISFTDANAAVTSYAWDKAGNMNSVKDANGNATNYYYDALNRNTQEQFADKTTKTYTYDAAGNLQTRKDNKGVAVQYKYDKLYRPVVRIYPSASDSFTYDASGHLLKAKNNQALVTFTYDAAYRINSETLNGKTTSYQHNIAAGTKTIKYPSGRVIKRQSDFRDQLISIKDSSTGKVLASFNYDAIGENTDRILGNNTVGHLTYNSKGEVTNINYSPTNTYNVNYTYDKESNPLTAEFLNSSFQSEQYGYDKINQLTKFIKGSQQSIYNYDGVGNRTTSQINGVNTTYTTNSMNAYTKVESTNTSNYSYDANGNLINDGTYAYTYDEENRMLSANGSTSVNYVYDALGRRIKKVIGDSVINFYFDGLQVVEEHSKSDSVTTTYVWGTWLDDIVSMRRFKQDYFYHTNTLGSVVAITDSIGAIKERYNYNVFGNVYIYDKDYKPIGQSIISNEYAFTGREYEQKTNKYFYRARLYSPTDGRFIERDPLGYIDDLNQYAYVQNMPNLKVDPLGLQGVNYCNLVYRYPTGDCWSALRITTLDERLRTPTQNFINAVEEELNIVLRITTSYRSTEEQDLLYAQGRTASGNIVTNAEGGDSYHNYRLAFDVVIMRHKGIPWNSRQRVPDYTTKINKQIAEVAMRYGFEWGGTFKSIKDYPHFQMTFNQSIKTLKKCSESK